MYIFRHCRAAMVLLLVGTARGQYPTGSYLHELVMDDSEVDLEGELKNLPDLEDKYHPDKYEPPRDFYVYNPPDPIYNYTMNVIFDPCRNYEFNCCNDTYGTPEYPVEVAATSETPRDEYTVREDGTPILFDSSRVGNPEVYVQEHCKEAGVPYKECIAARLAKRQRPGMYPKCWNFNDTLVADRPCRAPSDGSLVSNCIEIAYTQTAYIVECGGDFEDDPHCGTFLEVHRPGHEQILAEVKIKAVLPSGYRMLLMTMSYKREADKVLCYDKLWQGRYEIWWVQRTRIDFVVQKIMPFRVISPWCDWDVRVNRYMPYATVPAFSNIPGDIFDPSKVISSRTRMEGKNGVPGPGMGSVYVERQPDSYPPDAEFFNKDDVTYSYTPKLPVYTVERGYIEPPTVDAGDI